MVHARAVRMTAAEPGYVELAATSNFSFLRGASHPEELVAEAARLGLCGLSVTDRNSLAGVVRAHMAAKEADLAFVPGCRLVFADGTPDILVWPQDRAAYGRLCELLTAGKRRAPKGECHLSLEDLLAHGDGLVMAIVLAPELPLREPACLPRLAETVCRPALSRRRPALPGHRPAPAGVALAAGPTGRPAAAGGGRRALPPPGAAFPAGRGDLHPRAPDAARGGQAAAAQCRAAPAVGRRDAAPVQGL